MRLTLSAALFAFTAESAAQSAIPLRPLGPVVAVSGQTFTYPPDVSGLANGRLLVRDMARRVVLSLDSMLANPVVAIDSSTRPYGYGPRPSELLSHLADSAVFIDGESFSMLVFDPSGQVARVAKAFPVPGDLVYSGSPAIDARGRLIYRLAARQSPVAYDAMPAVIDSAFLVALDLERRATDTIATIRIRPNTFGPTQLAGHAPMLPRSNLPPIIPTVDGWVVTSTGAIAIVRGSDYHVDWIAPDGSRGSSPRIPHTWTRIPAGDKARFADSLTRLRDSVSYRRMAEAPASANPIFDIYGGVSGFVTPGRAGTPQLPPVATPQVPETFPIPERVIPDSLPAFSSVTADADGRLWILKSVSVYSSPASAIYDIVDSAGTLVDRVQLPPGRRIAGFGRGGTVYLTVADGKVMRLEKARFR